jgi:hypothetical protein
MFCLKHFPKLLATPFVAFGFFWATVQPTTAQEIQNPDRSAISATSSVQPDSNQGIGNWQDGIYLYGQSPEAEQIGQAYMVFEVQDQQVMGAFYMPFSSFDCFSGVIEADRFALNIVNSYTDEAYDYTVAVVGSDPIASANGAAESFSLEGFSRIATVSDNDRRILNTCKADQ